MTTQLLVVPAGGTCSSTGNLIDGCVSNSGTSVDIGADWSESGDDAAGRVPDPQAPIEQAYASSETGAPASDPCPFDRCRDVFEVVVMRDVTLADLASFVPERPTISGEPAGVGIVGAPTNLVATASTQHLTGRLLDRDVVVRFTPAAFEFDHGDGTRSTSATGGASWASLGQAQFTPTATSHVFSARGTYTVAVTVLYSAEVDFGRGWRPVPGYVRADAGGYAVRIVEVRTALVDKTCIENPSGPGC